MRSNRQAILDTIRANGHAACYIRPLVFRGAGSLGRRSPGLSGAGQHHHLGVGTLPGTGGLEKGVDVGVSSWQRMAPNTFPAAAKIGGQYVNSQFIVMEAAQTGYAEGIALDANGYVSEGSGENIFVVRRWANSHAAAGIFDPARHHPALRPHPGRGSGLTGVREQSIPRELLYMADEVFFTRHRSRDHAHPLGRWHRDRRAAGAARSPSAAGSSSLASSRAALPDRHGWLTPVS